MVKNQNNSMSAWQKFRKKILLPGGKILRGVLVSLVVVVLLLIIVLGLAPLRSGLLNVAVGQVHRFLPGEFSVQKVSWTNPGYLEIHDLLWVVSPEKSLPGLTQGDTLAMISHLRIEVDLGALRQHDLVVREILLDAGPVDVPSIVQLFPPSETVETDPDTLQGKSFLNPGSIPGIPSIAVSQLDVSFSDLQVDSTMSVVHGHLLGQIEMRPAFVPEVSLSESSARVEIFAAEPLVMDAKNLKLNLSADVEQSRILLSDFSVEVNEAGTPEMAEAWRNSETVSLSIEGKGHWTSSGASLAVQGKGTFPGPEHVRPLLPPEFPADLTGPLIGHFTVEGGVEDFKSLKPIGNVRLDFSDTKWLEKFFLTAGLENDRLTVETLDVALLGTSILMAGRVDSTEVDVQLEAQLVEPTLLRLFGGQGLQQAEARGTLQVSMKGLWPYPDVDLNLNGFADTAEFEAEALNAEVRSRNHEISARIKMTRAVVSGATEIDSLLVNLAGNFGNVDSLTHEFSLGLWAPHGRISLGGHGLIDSVRTVHLDSFVVVGLDSTMQIIKPATIIHGPGPKDLIVEDFKLEGGLGKVDLQCQWNDSGLNLNLLCDLLFREDFLMTVAPSEFWQRSGGSDVSLNARLDLEGGPDGPVFEGKAGARLVPHRDDPPFGLDLDFHLLSGDSSGLGADLNIFAGDLSLVKGIFRWPGRPDIETGKWVPDPDRGLVVRFPEQELDLQELNPVMPPDVSLKGMLRFGAELVAEEKAISSATVVTEAGFLAGSAIRGSLGIERLSIELPNRSRAQIALTTEFSGKISDPVIKGDLRVLSGFFRIPEMPPSLLPVEGESLLWQAMAENALATGDSVAYAANLANLGSGPSLEKKEPVTLPEMEIRVTIPGTVVVNGYGLNIELESDLLATRSVDSEGTPMVVLKGSAGVPQGTLKFMNNIFDVETANIKFNNSAPPNPHLNIKLTSDVSGYLINLEVSGFANEPVVELSSEPDMNQADIIAVLLFGQPANDLDNDQRGRANEENDPGAQLRDNLAALAVVFGGAGIQNKVSNTLGVDMVELGSGSDGDSTLSVGKFLTPKILLKYNQSLEKSGTYFMTMEYSLSKYFKLLSTYGEGEETSGLELKWTKRY
ncbi:MAG: hypothetical protein GY780_15855 [bacterium]|nr:hypothetical protein [bacterium]